MARLKTYDETLRHWQSRLNLVSPSSLADSWRRHFLDSAQLFPLIPPGSAPVIDLGAGAGFPGLVLAILGIAPVVLIESNARKCSFLREVARATATQVTIFTGRVEDFRAPAPARAVTARALASLDKLLALAAPLVAADGVCLFLKGAAVEEELTIAVKKWHMNVERIRSLSDDQATILKIRDLQTKGLPQP